MAVLLVCVYQSLSHPLESANKGGVNRDTDAGFWARTGWRDTRRKSRLPARRLSQCFAATVPGSLGVGTVAPRNGDASRYGGTPHALPTCGDYCPEATKPGQGRNAACCFH
jgi:hypothetical protein